MHFACEVLQHIEHYTVPQYGDKPGDQVNDWTPEDCIRQISKYTARFKGNQRSDAHKWRDMFKIAHYASIAFGKIPDPVQDNRI